jgi:mannitol/fructose-specific phosphotransferase system IIA component (Ntr-type)
MANKTFEQKEEILTILIKNSNNQELIDAFDEFREELITIHQKFAQDIRNLGNKIKL